MAEHHERSTAEPNVLDDASLGALVRDAADAWTMPPRRLDQPGWRDLVDRGRAPGRRRWPARFVAAGVAAVLGTAAVALLAVCLSQPGAALVPDVPAPAASAPVASAPAA